MMGTIFAALVKTSLLANWLIIAVLLLRLLLRKAPKRVVCVLWAIVAVRLLLPFSIESPVSLIPRTTVAFQESVDTSLIHVEAIPSETPAISTTPEPEKVAAYSVPRSSASVLPIVWEIGVAVMLGYLLLSYLRMRSLVKEAVPEEDNIWVCDAVMSPFILGILRPKIYLPSGLSGDMREYVLAHEKSHLRCKDHWWKPFAFVLLSIYWFDPLAWAAYFLVCRDIEFACDERVVRQLRMWEKKAYAEALLECSSGQKRVLVCPVAFGENAVVQRIRKVLNYRKPGFWIIFVSVLLILGAAIGFLTVPAVNRTPDEDAGRSLLEETISSATESMPEAEPTTPPVEEEVAQTEESNSEWAQYPDGIQIDTYTGETFQAHVMLVRDPSRVYLATSSDKLSMDTPGIRMDEAMEKENAVAVMNAGEYYDDGSASLPVGSVPIGLNISQNEVVWNSPVDPSRNMGFAGFNQENILIVAAAPVEEAEAADLGIRDGCAGIWALIVNGKPVLEEEGYGYRQRTAIGQRADGTVILVCSDGRNETSLGATVEDMTNILLEYKAVNAALLNGGSSANMLYRDTEGRYGEKGTVQIFNPESDEYTIETGTRLRRMPTFWMVK